MPPLFTVMSVGLKLNVPVSVAELMNTPPLMVRVPLNVLLLCWLNVPAPVLVSAAVPTRAVVTSTGPFCTSRAGAVPANVRVWAAAGAMMIGTKLALLTVSRFRVNVPAPMLWVVVYGCSTALLNTNWVMAELTGTPTGSQFVAVFQLPSVVFQVEVCAAAGRAAARTTRTASRRGMWQFRCGN